MSHKILKGFKQMANTEGYGKIIVSTLLGAALGITITYSTGVASNRGEIIRLATQVENLTVTIEERMNDRYTGNDARRDFALITQQIDEIKDHEARLEIRLDAEINRHAAEHK